MQMRSPPFVVYLKDKVKATFRPTDDSDLAMEDYLYVATAPKVARRLIVDRLNAPLAEVPDGSPCVWLDLKTKRCRFYEHRPIACLDFEVGEPACHGHREREGINDAR